MPVLDIMLRNRKLNIGIHDFVHVQLEDGLRNLIVDAGNDAKTHIVLHHTLDIVGRHDDNYIYDFG